MDDWKLPEHLEPYRGLIESMQYPIEAAVKFGYEDSYIMQQVTLLQRLYDAGKLK